MPSPVLGTSRQKQCAAARPALACIMAAGDCWNACSSTEAAWPRWLEYISARACWQTEERQQSDLLCIDQVFGVHGSQRRHPCEGSELQVGSAACDSDQLPNLGSTLQDKLLAALRCAAPPTWLLTAAASVESAAAAAPNSLAAPAKAVGGAGSVWHSHTAAAAVGRAQHGWPCIAAVASQLHGAVDTCGDAPYPTHAATIHIPPR